MASPSQDPNYRELHCEYGDHDYDWRIKPGRVPKNCSAHKPPPEQRERSQASVSAALAQVLERPSARTCRCGITAQSTVADLRALNGGCTAWPMAVSDSPGWVCPTLDAARRATA